jgi:hypothetical protein
MVNVVGIDREYSSRIVAGPVIMSIGIVRIVGALHFFND